MQTNSKDPARTTARLKAITRTILDAAPGISGEEYNAFLSIADNEGCCQADVQKELGLSQSTTSRTMANLNGQGHGLIHAEVDPTSRRRNNLRLSDKGRRLVAQLAVLLGCFAFSNSMLATGNAGRDGIPDMVVPMTGPYGPWDMTGHDARGHYDSCFDIRTFWCDVI